MMIEDYACGILITKPFKVGPFVFSINEVYAKKERIVYHHHLNNHIPLGMLRKDSFHFIYDKSLININSDLS